MKRLFLSAVLAILVAFTLSAAAQAGSITLKGQTFANKGWFDDVYFKQDNPGQVTLKHEFGSSNNTFKDTFKLKVDLKTALNFAIKTTGHVGLNFNLYDSTGAGTPLKSLFITSSGATTNNYIKITGALLAQIVSQSYVVLKITGYMDNCADYSIKVTPVPPALIMFLTALGGLGFAGFSRSKGAARRTA
jgi:hypothetical protein